MIRSQIQFYRTILCLYQDIIGQVISDVVRKAQDEFRNSNPSYSCPEIHKQGQGRKLFLEDENGRLEVANLDVGNGSFDLILKSWEPAVAHLLYDASWLYCESTFENDVNAIQNCDPVSAS